MKQNNEFKLLPNYFKKVGLGILLLTVLVAVILKASCVHLFPNKEYGRDIFMNMLVLGTFIIAFSKEKIEDERIRAMRYKAFAASLLFGVIFTIIHVPISMFIFRSEYEPLLAQQVMLTVMLWHLGVFLFIGREKTKSEE